MSEQNLEFDYGIFQIEIPEYKDMAEAKVQVFWDLATYYVSNQKSYCIPDEKLRYALNLFTAHLIYTQDEINDGSTPSIETSSTVDKVSNTFVAPPTMDQYDYQLNTTPRGQMFLLFLSTLTPGGYYVKAPWRNNNRRCGYGWRC